MTKEWRGFGNLELKSTLPHARSRVLSEYKKITRPRSIVHYIKISSSPENMERDVGEDK